jgi:hypothetical protein
MVKKITNDILQVIAGTMLIIMGTALAAGLVWKRGLTEWIYNETHETGGSIGLALFGFFRAFRVFRC